MKQEKYLIETRLVFFVKTVSHLAAEYLNKGQQLIQVCK